MQWLNGNKAYFGAIAFGVGGILLGLGVITQEVWDVAWPLIAGWTGIAIRHAIKKGK